MGRKGKTVVTLLAVAALASAASSKAADVEAGKAIYGKKCANCHGEDGTGNAKMAEKLKVEIPDISKPSKKSDAEIMKLLSEGKKPMPAFSKSLDPAAIDNVFAYAKTLVK